MAVYKYWDPIAQEWKFASGGEKGEQGYTGSRGAYDAVGFTGSHGYTGSQGEQGIQGYAGSSVTNLNELTDVTLTDSDNYQVLVKGETDWINGNPIYVGSSAPASPFDKQIWLDLTENAPPGYTGSAGTGGEDSGFAGLKGTEIDLYAESNFDTGTLANVVNTDDGLILATMDDVQNQYDDDTTSVWYRTVQSTTIQAVFDAGTTSATLLSDVNKGNLNSIQTSVGYNDYEHPQVFWFHFPSAQNFTKWCVLYGYADGRAGDFSNMVWQVSSDSTNGADGTWYTGTWNNTIPHYNGTQEANTRDITFPISDYTWLRFGSTGTAWAASPRIYSIFLFTANSNYETTGSRISTAIDLTPYVDAPELRVTSLTYTPLETSVTIETAINGGTTPLEDDWIDTAYGDIIAYDPSQLSGFSLWIRQTLTTTDQTVTPTLARCALIYLGPPGGSGSGITVSPTPPESPEDGTLWIDTSVGSIVTNIIYEAHTSTPVTLGSTPVDPTLINNMQITIPASSAASKWLVNAFVGVDKTGKNGTIKGSIAVDSVTFTIASNAYISESKGMLVFSGIVIDVPGDSVSHTVSVTGCAALSTDGVTYGYRSITAQKIS